MQRHFEVERRTVTIADSASLSNAIDISNAEKIAILVPSGWDAADITFQTCDTVDGTYLNVHGNSDTELTYQAAASRAIVNITELAGCRFVKFRSGTSGSPVNQTGAVVLTILLYR